MLRKERVGRKREGEREEQQIQHWKQNRSASIHEYSDVLLTIHFMLCLLAKLPSSYTYDYSRDMPEKKQCHQ